MSYTTIYKVPEYGEIIPYREFQNAFRGAYYIWEKMVELYMPGVDFVNDLWLKKQLNQVWNLIDNNDIPVEARIVLGTTFDYVMIRKSELPKVTDAFRWWTKNVFDAGDSSLPQQEDCLVELYDDLECFAVCWSQTSVSFFWHVEENGDVRLYDISKDERHWFLFPEEQEINV